ncbi:hypothetical protein llap_15892 [Limosa lapponica baueri]|uniref:Uncharacterized protein n=1 Tax=Limosa lapponica baueri TaxID=1758121 RepID=A0A2I0TJ18_LIMLA|nr:hypothetical protein llap_15892 [Limosa lapponica baueri]
MTELSGVPNPDKHIISTPANIRVKVVSLNIGVSSRDSPMINLMKYEAKWKVLCLGQDNPQYQYRLGYDLIESSPVKKDLGGWKMRHELGTCTCKQCVLAGNVHFQANCLLECIQRSVERRLRSYSTPLFHSGETPPEYCVQFWGPPHKKDMNLFEQVQRATTKVVRGLEHLFYEERVEVGPLRGGTDQLFSNTKRHQKTTEPGSKEKFCIEMKWLGKLKQDFYGNIVTSELQSVVNVNSDGKPSRAARAILTRGRDLLV